MPEEQQTKTTHLTLVRHGTTTWLEQGLVHGRLDAPLSAVGIGQVQAAAESLRGRSFDAFYASPTGRAMQSAQIIAARIHMQPAPLDNLMERDFGRLEGTSFMNLSAWRIVVRGMLALGLPVVRGAESNRHLLLRGRAVLDFMAAHHPGQAVLAVTHAGLINTLLRILSGYRSAFFSIPPAAVIELALDGKGAGRIITDVPISSRPGRSSRKRNNS